MYTKKATNRAVTVSVLRWSGLLVVGIVLVVRMLRWAGKMSSDATTFPFGILVGAAFSFVRDFFPNSRRWVTRSLTQCTRPNDLENSGG